MENENEPDIRTEKRTQSLWIWIDREARRNAINKLARLNYSPTRGHQTSEGNYREPSTHCRRCDWRSHWFCGSLSCRHHFWKVLWPKFSLGNVDYQYRRLVSDRGICGVVCSPMGPLSVLACVFDGRYLRRLYDVLNVFAGCLSADGSRSTINRSRVHGRVGCSVSFGAVCRAPVNSGRFLVLPFLEHARPARRSLPAA